MVEPTWDANGFAERAEDERGKVVVLDVFLGLAKFLGRYFPIEVEGYSYGRVRRARGAGARS
jgi:hypothetical protein